MTEPLEVDWSDGAEANPQLPEAKLAPADKFAGADLPHNLEAEEGLLSACFMDADNIEKCADLGGAFFDTKHALIFERVLDLWRRASGDGHRVR